ISISDVDDDDAPSFADVAATAGDNAYGSFVLTSGTWTYTLNQSAVQDLDAGDTVTDTITYTATDGTTQQITITITGTDDAAVVAGTVIGAVTEGDVGDAAETATGSISISDADDDDAPSFADVAATTGDNAYGSFVLTSGTWTYTLDQSAVQDLDAGDTVTDTITYTASDGTTQQITITITGTDDAAVVAGTVVGAVTEGDVGDAAETATGSISISDVDDDDTPGFADVGSTVGTNGYGSFVLSSETWTYTLNQSAVQDLDAGDTVTDTITYTATDGTTQQITITITGTDDAAVVAGTVIGAVTEGDVGDAAEIATGSISISDADDDDAPSFADVAATNGDNAYGSFVLTSGTWTYTLAQNTVQDLDAGDTVTDTITFIATDGTAQQITITITGTNDASVITGITTGAVTEGDVGDAAETVSGTLSVSDIDQDDTPVFVDVAPTSGDNGYGSFVLISETWTYTLNQSAVQDLDAGDLVTDSITFTAPDGETQQIIVTIAGSGDASVITGVATGILIEGNVGGAAETATGTLTVSDLDADDTPDFADVARTPGDNAYGSFVFTGGTWTYTLDQSTLQELIAEDSVTDTITYTASDGTLQQVTITITGSNDEPVVNLDTTPLVYTENAGRLAVIDGLSVSDSDTANLSGAVIQITGNYVAGEDELTFAALGAISGSFVSATGTLTLTGIASVADYQAALRSVSYENISEAPSVLTRTLSVTVDDGTLASAAATREINIISVNDAPMITSDGAGTVAAITVDENQLAVTTVTATDQDAEGTLTYSLGGTDASAFSIDSESGVLTFNPAPDYEINSTYEVDVIVTDNGTIPLADTQRLTITVNDVNEAPVIISDGGGYTATVAVNENQTSVTTVESTDQDAGNTQTYSLSGIDTEAFTIDGETGVLTFVSAPDHERKDTYLVEVVVTDNGVTPLSDRQVLTVTVLDVDDDLRVAEDSLSTREDAPLLFDPVVELLANDVDPKGGELRLQAFAQPENGTLSETPEGLLEYRPNADFSGLDYFDYTVEDEAGNTATARVSIDVEAVSDAPVLVPESVDTPAVIPGVVIDAVEASDGRIDLLENATVAGQVLAIDADGDDLTFSLEGPDSGLFEINSVTGELRPVVPLDFEAPGDADGDNQYELEILVTDSTGEQNRVPLSVTAVNTNEPPKVMESKFVLEEGFSGELGRLTAIDLDAGDELTFELSSTGETLPGVSLLTDGRLIADGLLPGTYELEVLVRDAGNLVSIGFVVIQVNLLADVVPPLGAALSETDAVSPVQTSSNQSATELVSTSIEYVPVDTEAVIDQAPYSVALLTSPPVIEVPSLQFGELFSAQDRGPVVLNFTQISMIFIGPSFDSDTVQPVTLLSEAATWSFTPTPDQMMEIMQQIRNSFDELQDQERDDERTMSLVLSFGTVTLSIGVAAWLLASRIMLAVALSTASLWRTVDPVPVLLGGRDHEEDDDDNGPDDTQDNPGHRVSNG
ncbi:MAG: VCBS domain-containing protein, partial [Granulosicoccus sp.]